MFIPQRHVQDKFWKASVVAIEKIVALQGAATVYHCVHFFFLTINRFLHNCEDLFGLEIFSLEEILEAGLLTVDWDI